MASDGIIDAFGPKQSQLKQPITFGVVLNLKHTASIKFLYMHELGQLCALQLRIFFAIRMKVFERQLTQERGHRSSGYT